MDLSTPEKAARVAFVALQSGNGGVDINDPDTGPDEEPDPEEEEKAEAKAAVLCNAGGTKDEPSTGQTRVFTYSNCKEQFENPEMLLLQDGVIRRDTVSTTATEVKTRVTYGSNGTSYLNEVMEPATERFRSLLIGTLDATDTFNSSGDQIGYGSQLRLSGAAINTSKSGKPRIDYRVGDDSTTYTSNIENLNQRVIKFVFAGPLAYSGACGAGSATVSTPTKIQYDTETSQYTGGQMMVQSTRGSATLTFNAEGTVSVSTAGGTQTYTIAQLASLCDAYN